MSSIVLEHLAKRFGEVVALDDLSLAIADGELVAFLGPSGCGKTTTLRLIAGFETPDRGAIYFGSRRVDGLAPERRDVGMVFQNYALFPHLTVWQNVAFGLEMRRLERQAIRERVRVVLREVQLEGLEGRYPRQLSGGQQQRTALARALVTNPSVLLLDEPLANLDANLREEMRFFIRTIQREHGITAVYVTHDQSEAMVLADRIAVLMGGRIVQVDRPEELYRRPRDLRVASFVGVCNVLTGELAGRRGDAYAVETPVGRVFASGPEGLGGPRVHVILRPEDLALASADRPDEPSADGRVRLPGAVVARAYLGNLVDVRVEVAQGLVLRVQARPEEAPRAGERVVVAYDPRSAWCVADA